MRFLLILLLLTIPAFAQQAYAPPDVELWRQMREALAQVSMPLASHQQVQSILQNVEQQAKAVQKDKPK